MFLKLCAVLGFTAVALGAFGAHGLKSFLAQADDMQLRLSWWEKATRYHMWHALLLGLIAILNQGNPHKWLTWSGWATFCGVMVFSGTLYLMTLTNMRILGAITPLGGLSLLTGWAFLGLWAFTQH